MVDLREALLEAARDTSAGMYLQHRDAGVTFSEIGPALAHIASQLPSLQGLRVIILLPDGLSAALLHLECFSQGATVVPLSPFSPAAHLQFVLERIQADLVFTTPVLHAKFAGLLQRTAVALVGSGNPISLQMRSGRPLRDGGTQRSPVRAVFFTSGTTGKPKGVCLSEGNLLSAACINRTILGLDSSRRSLITVPLYDYYGLIQIYSHAQAKAACTLGESGQFPRSAFAAIDAQAITDIVLVPFTLKALVDYAQSKVNEYQQTWRRVAYVASSSDQLSPDLLRDAFTLNAGLTVVNVYGLTEAGRACYRVIREGSNPATSIGKPSPTMKVWVDAPRGQSGEIVVSGPTAMLGYLQDVVNNDEIQFAPVTEVRTADKGYVGDDGEIHLLGRTDHLMSLHGVKLHPSEIELFVNQLSGVRDSLAELQSDGQGNKTIVLDVVADPASVGQNQILDLLRERVPRLFLPSVINFVDAIPRTEIGGKLIRRH